MFWYKIAINDGGDEPYNYIGASNETLDGLVQKATRGDFIHLTDLLYRDRGEIKSWKEWDASLEPEIFINAKIILTIMQFKGDPRITPDK